MYADGCDWVREKKKLGKLLMLSRSEKRQIPSYSTCNYFPFLHILSTHSLQFKSFFLFFSIRKSKKYEIDFPTLRLSFPFSFQLEHISFICSVMPHLCFERSHINSLLPYFSFRFVSLFPFMWVEDEKKEEKFIFHAELFLSLFMLWWWWKIIYKYCELWFKKCFDAWLKFLKFPCYIQKKSFMITEEKKSFGKLFYVAMGMSWGNLRQPLISAVVL